MAKDVCDALGYERSNDAVYAHCKQAKILKYGEIPYLNIPTRGMQIIPESDVYRLIIRSKLPSAEQFERWVMEEVLPAIRKHGGYLTPSKVAEALLNPDVLIQLATNLKEEQAARQAAEAAKAAAEAKLVKASAALEAAAPKAQILDAVFAVRSRGGSKPMLFTLTEVARKLEGVNTMKIKSDLYAERILYKTKVQYRVYAQFRDSGQFVEKYNEYTGKHDIYATEKGVALLSKMYHEGRLTMKAAYC